jgi:hydroxymethylglutaryl-CoA reductase (NADPH)
MQIIPSLILRMLYCPGSLHNTVAGFRFELKNRLNEACLCALRGVSIDGSPVAIENVTLHFPDGRAVPADRLAAGAPVPFTLGARVVLDVAGAPLTDGLHRLVLEFRTQPYGDIKISVQDSATPAHSLSAGVPRSDSDDYAESIVAQRQALLESRSGVSVEHLKHYSFDPHMCKGNIENFIGVAQVPIGLAGPLRVAGEHADGEFLIPLCATEGSLVASYNRGMKLLNLNGGAKCTVLADVMQRAPVFVLDDARCARHFAAWVESNVGSIREAAESTSSVARLAYIDPYLAGRFVYLRFNYTTGDAAGMNMVGRATFAACSWIVDRYEGIRNFYLEANFATDKKSSKVNMLHTRGKRVTAEAIVSRDSLLEVMRVTPEQLRDLTSLGTLGAFLAGANNNGGHSSNAVTALFLATGQDVANVAESSAGLLFTEVTKTGDLYIALTLPALIVATYGGGTGLATQRECLEVMGCFGKGKVRKLAEIVAGVALAGELSLGSAICATDWVSAHDRYGRNR